MKAEEKIESLLNKHIEHRLSAEEAQNLKDLIDTAQEDELNSSLLKCWNSYSYSGAKRNKIRKEVLAKLSKVLSPRLGFGKQLLVWRSIAAILIGLLIISSTFLYINREQLLDDTASTYLVQVGKGEKATVVLPDGTKVYLNAQSSLSYPVLFGRKNREVNLAGEAYFEVRRNDNKPFIVHTSLLSVKVLGTVFNIYAPLAGEYCETTLVEGKVEVILNVGTPRPEILYPKQKLHYNKQTDKYSVSSTDLWEETAWRRGDLIFHSQTFSDIIAQLETYYGDTINVEGNASSKLFSGSFHEEDVTELLLNLQQHYRFTFRKVGTIIYLKLN